MARFARNVEWYFFCDFQTPFECGLFCEKLLSQKISFLHKSALEDKDYIDFSHVVSSIAKIAIISVLKNSFEKEGAAAAVEYILASIFFFSASYVKSSASKAGRLETPKVCRIKFPAELEERRSKRSSDYYDGDYEGEYRKDPFPY